MFGSNMETPNRMLSFDSAYNKWKAIKPIRGRQDQNSRPLARRGNDNLTIRQDPDTNDIVVRFYNTDVIRYLSNEASTGFDGLNNHIEITPYPSVMTNRVMWSILGPHVNTHWTDRWVAPNHITEVGGLYYHTPGFVTVAPKETGWEIVAGSKPIEVPYLDRREGRRALRDANYYTFKLWLAARVRLGVAEFGHRWGSSPYDWTPRMAMTYLKQGEEGWVELNKRMSNTVPIEAELRSLREAVYKSEMCYDTETVEYFESYKAFSNAMNQIKRVG